MRAHWPSRTRSAFLPRLQNGTWGVLAMVGWAAEGAERRNLGPLTVLDTRKRVNVSQASLRGILALWGRERNPPSFGGAELRRAGVRRQEPGLGRGL